MELSHDPRTKQYLKDVMYDFLYKPVKVKYATKLRSIILRNRVRMQSNVPGFMFKGATYLLPNAPRKLPGRIPQLAPELHTEMNQYLKEVSALNDYELPHVLGFITLVLNTSNDLQDYLALFPESVHKPILDLITTSPCHNTKLSIDQIADIKTKHQTSIDLMRQRLLINILE